MKPQPKTTRTTRLIDELTSHPDQDKVILDVSETDLVTLMEDIRQNGQQHPVEITADNIIIDGHQRVNALKRLGKTEVWVVVRKSLKTKEQVAIRFIEANLNRRQMDTLARVRAAKRLCELRGEDGSDGNDSKKRLDLRIAKYLSMDDRLMRRYLKVLETPLPIQQAVSSHKLNVTLAEKVASLSKTQQSRIGERISEGENANKVVNEYLRRQSASRRAVATPTMSTFVSRASDCLKVFRQLPADVEVTDKRQHVCLKALRDHLNQLLDDSAA